MSEVDWGVPVDASLNTVCHSNEEGFARILALYARPGQTIADVTFGNGRFWKAVDASRYDALLTDIKTGVDFRALPYGNESVDMLVLDPPYRYTPAKNAHSYFLVFRKGGHFPFGMPAVERRAADHTEGND